MLPFSCVSFVATTGSDDALFGGRFLVPLVTIFFLAGFVSVAAATAAGVDDGGGNVLVDDFGVVVLFADVGWEVVGDDIVCITPFVSLLFFPLVLFVLVVVQGMDAICVGKKELFMCISCKLRLCEVRLCDVNALRVKAMMPYTGKPIGRDGIVSSRPRRWTLLVFFRVCGAAGVLRLHVTYRRSVE